MDYIGIIGAIGIMLGGVYGLLNKQQGQNEKQVGVFLDHLEKKDERMEQIGKDFSDTIRIFQPTLQNLNEKLDHANTNYVNMSGVLSDVTKALNDHHKHE